MPAVVRTTVHSEAHAVVAQAANAAQTDLVESSASAAAAEGGLAACTHPHPFSAAVALGESNVRTPRAAASSVLAVRGVAMGGAAVAGVAALDQTDAENAVDLSTVEVA